MVVLWDSGNLSHSRHNIQTLYNAKLNLLGFWAPQVGWLLNLPKCQGIVCIFWSKYIEESEKFTH